MRCDPSAGYGHAVRLISAFEVTADEDAAFVASWEQARDLLSQREGASLPVLHRALRPDVAFRFVNVARVDSPKAWRQAIGDTEQPGATMPFKAHSGLYEVVHEDGIAEDSGGVILINPFEVPAGDEERFLAGWEGVRALLATQRGYLGTRLHRSLAAASFRFVNIARWSSPLMFSRAVQRPELQQAAAALTFASHPALYQVVSA
jgi:heme-degrading monooxygenase HmoA